MEINFKKKIGNLELCPVTYLNGKKPDTLEICQWDRDYSHKWQIGSFEKADDCWEFRECGSRLSDENIEPYDFFTLLKVGRQIMDLVPIE